MTVRDDIEGYSDNDEKKISSGQKIPIEVLKKIKSYSSDGYYSDMKRRTKQSVKGAFVGALAGVVYALYFNKRPVVPYALVGFILAGTLTRIMVK
ncbi:MAG: hypothetical protein LUO93_09510 [Methanomicrobiales archaeon]|nr:hypothetical protein [Methanomicrobiales archaeon]